MSSSSDDGGALPGWIFSLKPLARNAGTLAEFASNPVYYIRRNIALFVVSGVLSVIELTTGRILWIWSIFADAVGALGDSLAAGAGGAGDAALGVVNWAITAGADMAAAGGPFGTLLVSLWVIGLAFVLWHVLKRTPSVLWKVYQVIPGT